MIIVYICKEVGLVHFASRGIRHNEQYDDNMNIIP